MAELAALASLFTRPWDQPVAALSAAAQAFVLHAAGFHLRALGRLAEALAPMLRLRAVANLGLSHPGFSFQKISAHPT